MSTTGTYCLWLHRHQSTRDLSKAIDRADWWTYEKPIKGSRGYDTFYYWAAASGPYYTIEVDGKREHWPIEHLIDVHHKDSSALFEHYALFVFCEGDHLKTQGGF